MGMRLAPRREARCGKGGHTMRQSLHLVRNAGRSFLVTVACALLTSVWDAGGAAAAAPLVTESAAWGVVPSPNAGKDPSNVLNGIGVLSSTDIWAVGSYGDLTTPHPQVQHWDGSRWKQIAIPEEVGE